ncbi:type II secretion system minor pseudopilin GspI [Thalassotalea nanhaiensis]|uniref:Type II secretion system protein I n=1 Tax=Thalassotalea nanhaiensis TaxID=3065648 RepID=A0ABY9TI82_9GAMM|nr:type II secretion system minor pseudopilin GspI [Colwelliaceae bacterium SQ345]
MNSAKLKMQQLNSQLRGKKFHAAGFTLIEVMLALTIFAFAGTALMKVAGSSLLGSSQLEEISVATWVASNELVEANLLQTWPPKKKSGKTEMAGREWHWQHVILPTEDKNMRAITIEVRANESDKNSIASLITYVSNPKAQK